MGRSTLQALTLATSALVASSQAQTTPQNVPFNTSRSHGPDGPWNYITLNIGDSSQSFVDFYPSFGTPASFVPTQSLCANGNRQCISPEPGYYNAQSEGATGLGVNTTSMDITAALQTVPIGANLVGTGYNSIDTVNQPFEVENMTIFVSNNATSHDNQENFVPVGLLSLEPRTNNATRLSGGRIAPGQQTMLQAYTDNTDGSGTVGLHMGSAAYNQSGSLYLGGYDQNRLIEPPAVFENVGSVNISSISFGHAAGLDPWSNSARPASNFLTQDLVVFFSPHVANMLFPQSLCNLFMQYLPITYDDDTNLYLWNTSSPLYTALMSSPSYMNFTFHDGAHTSIKIPFALLNLTLTSPVKNSPTPYFPCQPRGDTTNLGRAFLQGAMYIQSYNPPRIIVGQAPGPSVNSSASANVQALDASNPTATQGPNSPRWNDTWAAHLTPLAAAPSFSQTAAPGTSGTTDSSSNSGSSSLSGGAIAGIVIGVLVGVGLIAGAIAFFLIRRRRAAKASSVIPNNSIPANQAPYVDGAGPAKHEKYTTPGGSGLPGTPAPGYTSPQGTSGAAQAPAFGAAQEIDGREGNRVHEAGGSQMAEMSGGHGFVAELPDTSTRAEVGGTDTQRWSTPRF